MGEKKREMTWAYGAFWPISVCKRGSDVPKMRRGQNKTMFAGYFWEEQQLFLLPLKSKASVVDNWLLYFFLFSSFNFLETWSDGRWVSDICQPLRFLSCYNVKCKWAHASRRDIGRGGSGEIFSLNMGPRSVNRTVTLRNWEFWLIESPLPLPPPSFPRRSSYTN